MKLKAFILILTLVMGAIYSLHAQCPNFAWAVPAGKATADDKGNAITVDTINHFVYVTGNYFDPGTFGSSDYSTFGSGDIFIAKMDYNGNYVWVTHAGGVQNDEGRDICVDKFGDVYVSGSITGNAKFDNLTTKGGRSFIAKYNAAGHVIWVKDYDLEISCIETDNQGNLLTSGSFWWWIPFEGDTLSYVLDNDNDIILAKFDSSGSLLWKKTYGSPDFEYAYGLSVDGKDNVYIGGYFYDTLLIESDTLLGGAGANVYVAQFSANGNFVRSNSFGGGNTDGFEKLKVDKEGNLFILGNFFTQTQMDTLTVNSVYSAYNHYLAKFDSNWSVQWVQSHNGRNTELDFGKDGEIFVSGYFYKTMYYTNTNFISAAGDYDAMTLCYAVDGTLSYIMVSGGIKEERAYAIAADQNGDYYMTGEFAGTAYFSDIKLDATIGFNWNYTTDIFIGKVQNQAIKANAGADQSITCSQSVKLEGSANLAGSTFKWNPSTGLDDPNSANPMASPTMTTDYRLIVIDQCSNTDTDFVKVTVAPLNVTADAGLDKSIVCGEQVQLEVITNSPDATYKWSPSTGLNTTDYHTVYANPKTTTTYTVTVTDKHGCGSKQDQVTVSVEPIQANAGFDVGIVCGEEASIGRAFNPNVNSYSWLPVHGLDNSTSNSPKANPAWPTTYTLTLKDVCGNTTTDEVLVNVERTSHFSYTINGMVVNFNKLNSKCSNFLWEFGNGVTSQTNPTPVITYANPGTYFVCLACLGQPTDCNTCTNITLPGSGGGSTSGLEEVAREVSFDVYPNPSNGVVFFTEEIDEIKLFDINGKLLVHQLENLNQYQIPNQLVDGLYFMELRSDEHVKAFKVMLSR